MFCQEAPPILPDLEVWDLKHPPGTLDLAISTLGSFKEALMDVCVSPRLLLLLLLYCIVSESDCRWKKYESSYAVCFDYFLFPCTKQTHQ